MISQTAHDAPRYPGLKCRTVKTNIHAVTDEALDEVDTAIHTFLTKVGKRGLHRLKYTSARPSNTARSMRWCADVVRQIPEDTIVQKSALADHGQALDGDFGKLTVEDKCEIAWRTKPVPTRKPTALPIILINVHILEDHHIVARRWDDRHDNAIAKHLTNQLQRRETGNDLSQNGYGHIHIINTWGGHPYQK